jgi:hypothetical protein
MSPLLGHGLPYGSHIKRMDNPPREPSADWWLLTTTNATGTNGLTCLPKHGGVRDNTFLVARRERHAHAGAKNKNACIDLMHSIKQILRR